MPAGNDDLLSGTRPRIRQRRDVDQRRIAVFLWRSGRGRCRRLADDLKFTALNNDALDGVAQGLPQSNETGSSQRPLWMSIVERFEMSSEFVRHLSQ